jgi:hypothetical protein
MVRTARLTTHFPIILGCLWHSNGVDTPFLKSPWLRRRLSSHFSGVNNLAIALSEFESSQLLVFPGGGWN